MKSPIHIEIKFSESIDDKTGCNIENYALSDAEGNAVRIYGASVQSDPRIVILNTEAMEEFVTYFLTVRKNITDLWQNAMAVDKQIHVSQ